MTGSAPPAGNRWSRVAARVPAPCSGRRPGFACNPRRPLLLAIRFYKYFISPLLGPRCRFAPSCADYACEAIERHGLARGLFWTVRRLGRCHPWGGSGYDPVPPVASAAGPDQFAPGQSGPGHDGAPRPRLSRTRRLRPGV